MTHSNNTNKYKDRLVRMLSMDEIREIFEKFIREDDAKNLEKLFALLRNLVDDNNILIESRGDEIMNIIIAHVNMNKEGIALNFENKIRDFENLNDNFQYFFLIFPILIN